MEHFIPPTRYAKNMHNKHFTRIYAKTDMKFSFVPNTIQHWNAPQPDIFCKSERSSDPISTFAEIVRKGLESNFYRPSI